MLVSMLVASDEATAGHQEGGTDFAVHQRLQPLALLLLGAVPHEHFHVAGIGRRAVEHFGRPVEVSHLLREQRVFEIGQAGAAEFIIFMLVRRHEHVPETFGPRLLLQVFEDRITFQRSPLASCSL
jgi:hypothetical protein